MAEGRWDAGPVRGTPNSLGGVEAGPAQTIRMDVPIAGAAWPEELDSLAGMAQVVAVGVHFQKLARAKPFIRVPS